MDVLNQNSRKRRILIFVTFNFLTFSNIGKLSRITVRLYLLVSVISA